MDPQLVHGDPPLETRAGSPVQAEPWGLDSDTPARGPASPACDSLVLLLLLLL